MAQWTAMGAHSEPVSGKGLPDRLVFWGGATLLVETKSGKRGLTPAQVTKFSELHAKGIRVWVVRDGTDATRLLTGMLKPWTPEQGAGAGSGVKKRAHRPGVDKARAVAELCTTTHCPTSKAPGYLYCVRHRPRI